MEMNMDKMGVTLTKPTPELAGVDLSMFEKSIAWVKSYAANLGYNINSCTFDMHRRYWFFYEDGRLILRLAHDTMEALWMRLRMQDVAASPLATPSSIAEYKEWIEGEAERRRQAERQDDGS